EGYEIVTASDGKQALARLRDGPNPDLIILDLMLPALDGWEFRTIQRADPELSRIPVLAVSADSSAKAEAIDATSFLRKPFGAEDLLQRVHKILSERVRMEARMAETERLVSLGKLAAEATHEMSNPLGSVVANVASIEQLIHRMKDVVHTLPRDLDRPVEAGLVAEGRAMIGDMQETVRDIRVGTERMTRALNELRSTRPETHPFGPVDIRAVLDGAIALTSHEIRPRARLITELPASLPAVRGNEFRLGQLFSNLLLNAAHAIPPGAELSNRISITVIPGRQNLVVEIADTGRGMTPEVRARVFEPFFTTKPAGAGTGLGLPICKAIVQEHLGRIEVESEPDEGSIFRVTLPLDRPRLLEATSEVSEAGERKPGNPIRVLPQAIRLNTPPTGPGPRRTG
ncbi:MAG TPA: HAMP domain-containing sensor histidine kinase, partial [Polyangia bacterium]|nr:HAMP domain-containing sensor histidine kinase [Polyangia bacterium]